MRCDSLLVVVVGLLSCAPARVAKPDATVNQAQAGAWKTAPGDVVVGLAGPVTIQDIYFGPPISATPDAGGCAELGGVEADGGGCLIAGTGTYVGGCLIAGTGTYVGDFMTLGDFMNCVWGGPYGDTCTPKRACATVPAGDGCNTCTVCDGDTVQTCSNARCLKKGRWKVADGGATVVEDDGGIVVKNNGPVLGQQFGDRLTQTNVFAP
jgi:hypothetical protein